MLTLTKQGMKTLKTLRPSSSALGKHTGMRIVKYEVLHQVV